jgi:hypothetical protein
MAVVLMVPAPSPPPATAAPDPALSAAPASPAGSGAPAVLALPGGVVWDYDGAQILRSTDAGATWHAVLPSWPLTQTSRQVTGAFFLNAEDAWAETAHQWPAQPGVTTTWQTTDGGSTWQQGLSLPGTRSYGTPGFDEFAFADARHGLGFGVNAPPTTGLEQQRRDYLWTTANGGHEWGQMAASGLPWQASSFSATSGQGCSQPDPFNLTAVSERVAVLIDAGCPAAQPGLWRSVDGGREWGAVHLPAPPGGWAAAEAWPYPGQGYPGTGKDGAEVLAVRFFGADRGVVAVTTRPGELLVYGSADRGRTWSLASILETGSLDRPAGFWASSPLTWELPAPAGLYVSTDGGRHWGLQRSVLSLPEMTEVSFASPASGAGFASLDNSGQASTGDSGLRTADGGQSWGAVDFSAPSFLGNFATEVPFSTLDFVTLEDGWVGGADGVEATTDGGRTWTAQLATAEPVEQLSFADPEHGWALTPDELFETSDGGMEWSAQPETPLGAFSDVQLVSPGFGVGVVCGPAGGARALATDDEGRTWSVLPLPGPGELDCGTEAPSSGTGPGLCFGADGVGWAVLRGPGGAPSLVEKTDDGGLEWSAVALVNMGPVALACQGTSDAWLGLDWMENMATVGSLATTNDGGLTWRTSVAPAPHTPFLVPTIKPSDGTAVGLLGTAQSPAGILAQPVAGLSAPAPGAAVDLWEDYGAGCANGFGLALTSDGGGRWAGVPARSPGSPPCGTLAVPFLGAVPDLAPAVSFISARDGFVLAPAVGTPAVPKGATEQVTAALVATADFGATWRLVTRFPWRPPSPTSGSGWRSA